MNRYKFLSYINRFKDAIAIAVLLFVCYCLYCLPSAYNGLVTNIPAVITSAYGVLLMYFLGRKISSKKYGLISALILASGFEYIYISSCCAADMLFSVCTASSVFAGLYTLFCSYGHRRFFWWSAYIFAGCAFILKGIGGIIIPVLTLGISCFIAGQFKNLFKPLYFVPGIIMFAATLFIKHPVSHQYNFQMFYKFLPLFLAGFMPWTFSLFAQIFVYLKKSLKDTKTYIEKFSEMQPIIQFMTVNTVFICVVFFTAFILGAKSSAYLLPAMFPASMMIGKFWFDYLFKDENERAVNISTLLLNLVLALSAAVILFVSFYVISFNTFLPVIFAIFVLLFAALNALFIFKDKKLLHFMSFVLFMIIFTAVAVRFLIPSYVHI